jgi:subtilisin
MAPGSKTQQFILMPRDGMRDQTMLDPLLHPDRQPKLLSAMRIAQPRGKDPKQLEGQIKVIDSFREDGIKLAELTPQAVFNLRATLPGVRVVPVIHYRTADRRYQIQSVTPPGRAAGDLQLTIKSALTGQPLSGATVLAFTDFAKGEGASGTTDQAGRVSLFNKRNAVKLDRLLIYPPHGYWGFSCKDQQISSGDEFSLRPIDLRKDDLLRRQYGNSDAAAGTGVTVGIIDTGVATNHPDLNVANARNMVTGEKTNDTRTSGDHGTHVAGIVAARGTPPNGLRGVAPGTTLNSYRVFGMNSETATNYDIAKAIDQAVADGCHLINLSLGSDTRDAALEASINDAYRAGTLAICAAGNDYRQPVLFPAAFQEVLAVSAFGQEGTFPSDSVEAFDVADPRASSDKNCFIGAFSNVGQEVALTAPGVGIISTVPDKDYAVLSGTSMACPAVTGCVARAIGEEPKLLGSPADSNRTQAFVQSALRKAVQQGFGITFEGHGLMK